MYTKKTKIIGAMLAVIMLMQVFCSSITSVVLAAEAENNVEITFVDENLYTAIKEEVKGKLKSYSDKDKTIIISNANLDSITSLNLSKKEIRSLAGIENFTAITNLDLTSNKIENVNELELLTNLQTLKLSNNNIEDCTPLEKLEALNLKDLTVGSQDLQKTIIINAEDIENNSFKYSLPQIFSYIKKVKQELGESIDLGSPVIEGKDTYLKEKINRAIVNEEIFEVQVNNIEEGYHGYVNISYEYRTATGLDTKLSLRLLVVNDEEKRGIVFEDDNLYYAVKANIEGTEVNGYTDSEYTVIRDDNDGCVWYDDILSLVINRHYLYKDIVELDLVNKKIENLEGLQYFVGLSDLDLSNNFISDISKLEEFGKQKETAEADLKAKVQAIYDELIENIELKEKCLHMLTDEGKRSAIDDVISEIGAYVDADETLSDEVKSDFKNYVLNNIDSEYLVTENKSGAKDLAAGQKEKVAIKKIDGSNEYIYVQIIETRIYWWIPTSGADDNGYMKLNNDVINYIKNEFIYIDEIINKGICRVDGVIIDVENVVNKIAKKIQDLEKYIDIEDLLLILPKETIELTESEIDSLTLEETKALAKEVVNAFRNAYDTLTYEEKDVSDIPTYEEMDYVLSIITDEDNDDYIGSDKYELKYIILEYINYQKNISRSHNILNGISFGYNIEILPAEIMDYTDTELNDLSLAGAKRLAIEALDAFIEAYNEDKLTVYKYDEEGNVIEEAKDDIIELLDLPSKAEIETIKELIQDGDRNYDTRSELVTKVIKPYRNYQKILSKDFVDYSDAELTSFNEDILRKIAIDIITKYIEEYDTFSDTEKAKMISYDDMVEERENIEKSTGSYDSVYELVNVITKYKGYQTKIDELYSINFYYSYSDSKNFMGYSQKESYKDYIKAALVEGIKTKSSSTITYNNYMNSELDTQDKDDVVNITKRFKKASANFEKTIALPKTKVLNLSSNNLTDISKLTSITSLVELYVRDNIIRDLSTTDFTKFEKLTTLDLSHNRIYETKIGLIPTLEHLNLAYNYIENINGMDLGSFVRLQSIDLSGNRIYDIQNIMYNLHLIANYQLDSELIPIINYSHDNAHIFTNTKVEECGYIVNKSKVKFEEQKIYASVADKIMQGAEEYVKLPAIFNQVKYIDCGETNFLNAKATNDGMITYLETGRLGEQTEAAYIQGTGIATGTICYITYTVATEEEVNKVLIEGLDIQIEKELTNNENETMPDIDKDGDVDSDDLAILNNTGINLTEEQMKIAKNIVPDDVYSASDRVLLKKYIEEKVEWTEKTLTAAIKAKAEAASMTGKDKPSKEDLLILTKYIMSGSTSAYTVEQLLEKLDLTGDKQLTALDAMYLTKYLAITSTERESIETLELKMIGNYKETKQLYALITPEDADPEQQEIVWRTSNQGAVTVDKNGIITAVGQGNAIITVASTKNSQVYDTIYVTVGEAVDVVDTIVMTGETRNKLARDYYIGEELDLTNCELEISRISGKTETVDITKEMVEGFTTENVTTESIFVKVKFEGQETGFNMNVLDWPDNRSTLTKDNFDDYLDVTIPTDAVYGGEEKLPEVTADENKNIGTITVKYADKAGNAIEKPVNAGTYKVLVDITDSIEINAAKDVEVGTFTIAQAGLPEDQIPSIATEYTVEKGGDFAVAVENGIVTKPEGTTFDEVGTKDVILTFVPNDSNYASIEIPVKVNVVVSVTGVNLNKNEYTIVKGGIVTLVATVMPEDATNKNIVWSSSDDTIAKVEDGKVTAVGVGEATITVTTKDGGKSTTCKVIVKEQTYGAKELSDGTIAIIGINPETTEEYFKNKFISGNTYKIFKADGVTELSNTDTIATGYKLKVYDQNGTVVEEQLLVVKGDTNGDGKATATDSGNILAHRTGEKPLENEYLLAADINNDGTVDGRDSTLLIYHRIGMIGYILQNN